MLLGLDFNNLDYLEKHLSPSELKPLLMLRDLLKNTSDNVICNFRHDAYHENIAFAVISQNSNATYARGGDYKINAISGCGASFYVEEILNYDIKK